MHRRTRAELLGFQTDKVFVLQCLLGCAAALGVEGKQPGQQVDCHLTCMGQHELLTSSILRIHTRP